MFENAFLGVANAPGSVLGYSVVRGVTLQASLSISGLNSVAVLLQMGSDGITIAGTLDTIPDGWLPSSLHIGNIMLMIDVPSSCSTRSSSFFLALSVTYRQLQFDGALYLSSSRQSLLAQLQHCSLSSLIPGVPSDFDLQIDALLFGYLSDGRLPNSDAIQSRFPLLQKLSRAALVPNQWAILLGAQISHLPFLDKLFQVGQDSSIQFLLAATIGQSKQIIT